MINKYFKTFLQKWYLVSNWKFDNFWTILHSTFESTDQLIKLAIDSFSTIKLANFEKIHDSYFKYIELVVNHLHTDHNQENIQFLKVGEYEISGDIFKPMFQDHYNNLNSNMFANTKSLKRYYRILTRAVCIIINGMFFP